MPTARASRTIPAPLPELWGVISDPHHLPRWWPRVTRVENVEADAFTEVMKASSGRVVRADFALLERDEDSHLLRWAQRVEGTPFERVLVSAETEVALAPHRSQGDATDVTIELRQALRGLLSRNRAASRWGAGSWRIAPPVGFGSFMVRRAAAATIEEALDGLERISG